VYYARLCDLSQELTANSQKLRSITPPAHQSGGKGQHCGRFRDR
jgi:hypothetical protein